MLFTVLAGCGDSDDVHEGEGASGAAPAGFPVTVTNCGVTTSYQHPPQRVVTMNQHTTEIMLALGLEDRMVGTAYTGRHEILPQHRDEYRQIPVLAEHYPSYEVLLAANPDFVYAGLSSAFSEQEGRSRQRLREAGIDTFLNPGYCGDVPSTMGHLVWEQLRTIGRIFGAPKRADQLVTNLQSRLNEVNNALKNVEPLSVFVYDSGTKAPVTAGGNGMANTIINRAGGDNIFADVKDEFGDVSWEQVIQRQPEVILIMDYGDKTTQEKKQFLLTKPELANVPAIKHRRFAVLPLNDVFAGIRTPRAVDKLAHQLHPDRFR